MGEFDPAQDGRKLVAEFIGTFTLIFIAAGSIVTAGSRADGLVATALAYGLATALMISALGHVSGGFFNPALAIGLWATRQLETLPTILYIIAQLLGAVAGALALTMLYPEVMRNATNLGVPTLNQGVDFIQGAGIEALATFFLMTAVFGTVIDPRGPRLGGFGVGLIVTIDVFATSSLTGAAMNPARALGPALVGGHWDDHLVWWVGPIIGAVLAALVYHYVFAEEQGAANAAA